MVTITGKGDHLLTRRVSIQKGEKEKLGLFGCIFFGGDVLLIYFEWYILDGCYLIFEMFWTCFGVVAAQSRCVGSQPYLEDDQFLMWMIFPLL